MNTDQLFLFIETMCQQYNIDESHGLKHAKGTMNRALAILTSFSDILDQERRIVLYAAALHDMCDHKYTDVAQSSKQIKAWLLYNQQWNEADASIVIKIITTMSYSQLKMNRLCGIAGYPDHGVWQRAYHIVRHADLLEGFIVARCVLYNRHIHPEMTEDQHWLRAEELFRTRVFLYISESWIFIPAALKDAIWLTKEAERCLRDRSLDWP